MGRRTSFYVVRVPFCPFSDCTQTVALRFLIRSFYPCFFRNGDIFRLVGEKSSSILKWKDGTKSMIELLILTTVGGAFGGIGGALASGSDGLILGGSSGFVIGVSIWAMITMGVQWRRERRLDRYFAEISREQIE